MRNGNLFFRTDIADEWTHFMTTRPIEMAALFDFKRLPEINDVIFNNPATIVKWSDGTKTVVKTNERYNDAFNPETGLAMAICKKALGNRGNFNDVFRKWVWDNERINKNV